MTTYTAITFAPVQGFIEKSRKLRDLYGSSFLLSYLADTICREAENKGLKVISPAIIKVTQGTPNQIVINGDFSREAESLFRETWGRVVDGCRHWIEENIKQSDGQLFEYPNWKRYWDAWKNHAWEFFCAVEEVAENEISQVKATLSKKKRSRNWIGINWTGESSTLSGVDGIAWYGMGVGAPKNRSMAADDEAIKEFFQQLSNCVGESIISPREQLSIPELIKRLITLETVTIDRIGIKKEELPKSFIGLNRHVKDDFSAQTEIDPEEIEDIDRDEEKDKKSRYSGWFQGDGDKAGKLLRNLSELETHKFSLAMRQWGEQLDNHLPKSPRYLLTKDKQKQETSTTNYDGRVVYAGGDDFLGVLYRNYPNPKLTGYECIEWLTKFESDEKDTIWKQHKQPISASVGFVWVGAKVPQREILQHCRRAEKAAKSNGRDRLAMRILFNSGNYLEWICPWWFLDVLKGYCDRDKISGSNANWTHIYNDVAALEARHAFSINIDLKTHPDRANFHQPELLEKHLEVALSIFKIYFPNHYQILRDRDLWWQHRSQEENLRTGIFTASKQELLDSFKQYKFAPNQIEQRINKWKIESLNNWVINLAKVGFHLCRQQ